MMPPPTEEQVDRDRLETQKNVQKDYAEQRVLDFAQRALQSIRPDDKEYSNPNRLENRMYQMGTNELLRVRDRIKHDPSYRATEAGLMVGGVYFPQIEDTNLHPDDLEGQTLAQRLETWRSALHQQACNLG